MSSKLLILDVSSLSHRNYYALAGKKESPVAYGLLRDLGTLSKVFGSTHFVFCFDGLLEHNPRVKEYPEYKANREWTEARKAIEIELGRLHNHILPGLGYKNILRRVDSEGDDLIAMVVDKCWLEADCVVVSLDHDLYQLLDKCVIYNPIHKEVINERVLERQTGIPRSFWVWHKAVIGDKGDNIVGVPGIGEVSIRRYIHSTGMSRKRVAAMEGGQKVIDRNVKLIKLPHHALPPLSDGMYFTMKPNGPTKQQWDSVCLEYDFDQLCGDYPNG